jgi:lysophospholipid acyltransferase (LPLAT)-like uncharacterized protein
MAAMNKTPETTPPTEDAEAAEASQQRGPSRRRRVFAKFSDSTGLLRFVGGVGAGYLKFVAGTSRMVFEPADPLTYLGDRLPVIVTTWHGHHFLATTFWPLDQYPLVTLISKHRDGEVMAAMAEGIGIRVIRGSGGRDKSKTLRSGGIRGFLTLKSTLDSGVSVFMTADISGISRRVGEGVIRLARASGRPIVGIGVASAPEIRLENWDRSRIALPFGRSACMMAPPLDVPQDADDALVEAKRLELEASLNSATARAYAAMGRTYG